MIEINLKFKIDGYAPVSVNPKAFDVPASEVKLSRKDKVWTANIQFETAPTTICGNIIDCHNSYEVTELHLPESVVSITTSLRWLCIEKPADISINKGLLSSDGKLIIHNGKVLRELGDEEEMVVPDGITTIGEGAFDGKRNLSKLDFPASVTTIEAYAFRGCFYLPVKLPRNLVTIGDYAFEGCGRDKGAKLTIPGKVTHIGNYAFKLCSRLTGVKIGKSVVEIGQGAFAQCDRISSFEGVGTEYGSGFLAMGKRLISVALDTSYMNMGELKFPDDIEEIGDYALSYADWGTHWRLVTSLPSGLKRIGVCALYGARGSSEPVVIPDTVEEIGEGAFSPEMRVSGKYVTADGAVIKDGVLLFKNFTKMISKGTFTVMEEVPEYPVPEGVTRIGNFANLKVGKLKLPEGLECIGEQAVTVVNEVSNPSTLKCCESLCCEEGCTSIEFPEGMVSAGKAFGLSVDVPETTLHSAPPIFHGSSYGKAILVVPKDRFAEYKEAYTGLLDERNFPNGRIAYRENGELHYELELSEKETVKKNEETENFWGDFESLSMANEAFTELTEKFPHGVEDGDGEKIYFIDIFPEYLRIELRYNAKTRTAACTLRQLQNVSEIYDAIHWFKFNEQTGMKADGLYLTTGTELNDNGIKWEVPAAMDNIGIYGTLFTAACLQNERVQSKIKKFLDNKAFEERVASGRSMYRKFYKQSEITEVEVPDTAGVTDFGEMFADCYELTSMPLFDTSAGINFKKTFDSCSSLTTLPDFDFSKAEAIDYICAYCRSLESIEWKTQNVRSFNSAFCYCSKLKHVVLDMTSAIDTGGVFYECTKLSDVTLINLGANPECTRLHLDSLTKWAKKNIIESLVKKSFDRTAAGFAPVEIQVASKVFTMLKPEDIATIEAKGFKLIR